MVVDQLEVIPDEGVVRLAGDEVHLTRTEFRLLVELASSPGKVMSREDLLERVWARDYFDDERLVDVHVRRLRTKIEPDPANLLGGKEDEIFPKLLEAGALLVADGADVICLGSTTMHESHGYLSERLPVPVINPGPLTYKLAETVLGLGLSHSRKAYAPPTYPRPGLAVAMMDGAAKWVPED